jgi:hypothetical protein
MMRVRDCHRQGVGRIGTGDLYAREQSRDHRVNLRLLGSARANHGFLDQPRRIFANLDSCSRCAHQDHAASLAELERRLGVLVDENFLDRGCGGSVVLDQCFQLIAECPKSARQGGRRLGLDLAIGDVDEPVSFSLDQSPAGNAEPGIEAENFQASFSSSSSGTS